MSGRYVRLPPGRGNVLVPVGSRRAALAGISLLTMSKPAALACQWLLYGAVGAFGPRVLPGARLTWEPPGDGEGWRKLVQRVGPFDELAVYERPQASRSGVAAVMLRGGAPVGFLKLRTDPGELDREELALSAFDGGRTRAFRVPRVLGRGEDGGWHWMVIEAMPPRPARPLRRPPVDAVIGGLQDALGSALPRAGAPDHWEPMHGDLTPWNLRKCGPGLPWLIDWEDASWAPPGADRVYHDATVAAVFGGEVARTPHGEAVGFWLDRVTARSSGDGDAALNRRLAEVLRAMRRPG